MESTGENMVLGGCEKEDEEFLNIRITAKNC